MRRVPVVLPLLLSAATALAQETTPPATAPNPPSLVRLTVDETVARAIAASPRLARLAALEVAAEAQARGARAERWPQVEVGAGYTRRSEVPELAIFAPTDEPGAAGRADRRVPL